MTNSSNPLKYIIINKLDLIVGYTIINRDKKKVIINKDKTDTASYFHQ